MGRRRLFKCANDSERAPKPYRVETVADGMSGFSQAQRTLRCMVGIEHRLERDPLRCKIDKRQKLGTESCC